ncbi:MAG: hypothetical protein NXI27_19990 [Alphaproteobacteria bacterium]|nr:hypothetical protein [Alphaproteobacteria bacterium]
MKPTALEDRLLAAHLRCDLDALVALYEEAADCQEADGKTEAACFYLTHAFVFALEAGHPDADRLQRRLWQRGREQKPHADP